jgi:hypothetical protein
VCCVASQPYAIYNIIPALKKLREEGWEFEASLGYKARLSPKQKKIT